MNFKRFFIVVVMVTACGGAFGAIVGGLIGYAVPQSMNAFFGVKHHEAPNDTDLQHDRDPHSGTNVRVAFAGEQSKVAAGAAIGGAWGLISAAILGFALGVVDQILLAISYVVNKLTSRTATGTNR